MTTPPPIADLDPFALTCTGDQVGLCAGCQRKTHRYGHGGRPFVPVVHGRGTGEVGHERALAALGTGSLSAAGMAAVQRRWSERGG